MVPRCQKCNADRRKVIIVRNGVGHVTDLELDVSGALSQCPSGDPAQQVQSSCVYANNKCFYLKGFVQKVDNFDSFCALFKIFTFFVVLATAIPRISG